MHGFDDGSTPFSANAFAAEFLQKIGGDTDRPAGIMRPKFRGRRGRASV